MREGWKRVGLVLASSSLLCACAGEGVSPVPGGAPTVFAFGTISGIADNLGPAFADDCKTVYFDRTNGVDDAILVSREERGHWSPPSVASFSGTWRDLEPSLSPDGSRLAFASNRPAVTGGAPLDGSWGGRTMPAGGGNLWHVDRQGPGWSAPERYSDSVNSTSSVFTPSLAANGNLYFMKASPDSGKFHLYRSVSKGGTYQPAERLPFTEDERWRDVDPTVSSDESYVVFSSDRPPAAPGDLDLFIAVRRGGAWEEPRHLGARLSSIGGEIEARLAPDDHTLYFTSTRTVAVHYPKSPPLAGKSVDQIGAWNTGLQHIWRADITSLIEGAGGRIPVRPHTCTPM